MFLKQKFAFVKRSVEIQDKDRRLYNFNARRLKWIPHSSSSTTEDKSA
jgi:hypothetical protein